MTGAGTSSGWPFSVMRRPCAPSVSTRTSAPKWRSMRSVWSRVASASTTMVSPGAAKPGEQHRGLELRRRRRRLVDDRDRIARARQGQRQPAAIADAEHARAHAFQRIEHAPHRPRAQRGIAVEGRRDRAARHRAHHQAAAGAGIAEIERLLRLREARDADPVHAPGALAGAFDARAQRAHRLAGVDHVLALEQALRSGSRPPSTRRGSAHGARSTCRRARGRGPSGGPSGGRRAARRSGPRNGPSAWRPVLPRGGAAREGLGGRKSVF